MPLGGRPADRMEPDAQCECTTRDCGEQLRGTRCMRLWASRDLQKLTVKKQITVWRFGTARLGTNWGSHVFLRIFSDATDHTSCARYTPGVGCSVPAASFFQ